MKTLQQAIDLLVEQGEPKAIVRFLVENDFGDDVIDYFECGRCSTCPVARFLQCHTGLDIMVRTYAVSSDELQFLPQTLLDVVKCFDKVITPIQSLDHPFFLEEQP